MNDERPEIHILSTGEEVLAGELVDTNAAWLSQQLFQLGSGPSRRLTVGDRMQDLLQALSETSRGADLAIVTGGLGPTSDDLSAQAASLALGVELEHRADWEQELAGRFAQRGRLLEGSNLKQCLIPKGSTMLFNPLGTACGFAFHLGRCHFFFLPGVPREMERMFRDHLAANIETRSPSSSRLCLRRLHFFGLTEARIGEWMEQLNRDFHCTLGYRAHFPTIEVKISAPQREMARIEGLLAALPAELISFLVARDEQNLPALLLEQLAAKDASLSTAESCTGGLLFAEFIKVPGASRVMLEAAVCYADSAKTRALGVDSALLAAHGAVSPQVAGAMAQGIARASGSTYALATSGIAGPAGGTPEKPVGTLALALATPAGIHAQQVVLPPLGREAFRQGACFMAMDMLRRHLQGLELLAPYQWTKRAP